MYIKYNKKLMQSSVHLMFNFEKKITEINLVSMINSYFIGINENIFILFFKVFER